MRHSFQISFMSSTNQKRRYCFSVPSDDIKAKWGQILQKQIAFCKSRSNPQHQNPRQLRVVAEKVSLQVLKDAVIPPDDPTTRQTSRARQGSVSTTYEQTAGRDEKALGPLIAPTKVGSESTSGLVDIRTGKELVLLCRQNSLLPGLLELLSAGREDHQPTSTAVPIGQHRPNGSFARGAGHGHALSRGQSPSYGHARIAGGGSISDAKRGIMAGRF